MANERQYYVVERLRCSACNGAPGVVKICASCFGRGKTLREVPFRQALVEAMANREMLQALRVSLASLEAERLAEALARQHAMEDLELRDA